MIRGLTQATLFDANVEKAIAPKLTTMNCNGAMMLPLEVAVIRHRGGASAQARSKGS